MCSHSDYTSTSASYHTKKISTSLNRAIVQFPPQALQTYSPAPEYTLPRLRNIALAAHNFFSPRIKHPYVPPPPPHICPLGRSFGRRTTTTGSSFFDFSHGRSRGALQARVLNKSKPAARKFLQLAILSIFHEQ